MNTNGTEYDIQEITKKLLLCNPLAILKTLNYSRKTNSDYLVKLKRNKIHIVEFLIFRRILY